MIQMLSWFSDFFGFIFFDLYFKQILFLLRLGKKRFFRKRREEVVFFFCLELIVCVFFFEEKICFCMEGSLGVFIVLVIEQGIIQQYEIMRLGFLEFKYKERIQR